MHHRYAVAICFLTLIAAPAFAQQRPTFSIDFQGPSAGGGVPGAGIPDSFLGLPINEGDILTTSLPGPPGPNPALIGPLPPPGVMVGAFGPGSVVPAPGLGILPGPFGFRELDALSYGRDLGDQLYFSVDEHAVGVPTAAPDVFSEGTAGSLEASADVFVYGGPVAPTPPGPILGNMDWNDGDGLAPPLVASPLAGYGLLEPNPFNLGVLPDAGDNLDAVDMDTRGTDFPGPIFFSLDFATADPYEPFPPVNSGTALGNGFSGADVVVVPAAPGPMALSCPAAILGLDLAGLNTDDLDALIFNDADGSMTCTPGVDTLYFSVRRGSAVIGAVDSCFGVPIEEGDILTFPAAVGAPPCLFIAAEVLGLATARSGTNVLPTGDELDALDIAPPPEPDVPAHPTWALAPLAALLLGTGLRLAQRRRRRRA